MQEYFSLVCPYCGTEISVYLETDIQGKLVQDCEVCCNPIMLHVWSDREGRQLSASRADGSE